MKKTFTADEIWNLKKKIDELEGAALATARAATNQDEANMAYAASHAYLKASRLITEMMIEGE